MNEMSNTVSIVALAAYFGMVVYRGNAAEFAKAAATDYGFAEFVVAAFTIKAIVDNPGTHEIALMVVSIGIIGALLKMVGNGANLSALTDFANGRKGLFETVASFFS